MAIGQGMLSSLLRGLGYGGALVDTLIAISLEVGKQSKRKRQILKKLFGLFLITLLL